MINFTHIKLPYFPFRIKYSESILSLGSCFSINMTDRLDNLKYNTLQNPAGITFNPASLSYTLKMLQYPNSLLESDSQCHLNLWSHPDFHGIYNHPDKTIHQKHIQESLLTARTHLQNTSKVLITLGTAYVFRSKSTGRIVNNCHKLPADQFEKQLMTIPEILTSLQEITTAIDALSNKDVQYIFSVSPVRHIKNGLIADRHSKSLLLVATHSFVQDQERTHYFPAYEILTDELRDYRYYGDDLIHPSKMAIAHIFEMFESALLSEDEASIRAEVQQLVTRKNHRALFPESVSHQRFLAKLEEDENNLKDRYPFLFN